MLCVGQGAHCMYTPSQAPSWVFPLIYSTKLDVVCQLVALLVHQIEDSSQLSDELNSYLTECYIIHRIHQTLV